MKLEVISEARYHTDARERFLNTYFVKEDQDEEDGWIYEAWAAKKDYVVVVDWDEGHGGREKLIIVRINSGFNKSKNEWNDDIQPYGWEDILPDTTSLQDLSVYKKIE